MFLAWTRHLKKQEDQEKFKGAVLSAKHVLERLHELLEEEEASIDRSEMDVKTFDNPNWAYLQAYKNGCRSQLQTIKKLINLDQQEHK